MKNEIMRMEHLITRGELTNLSDFNCQVYGGEIVGIIAINGYGKEQLIKVIENYKKLEFGSVFYEGKKVNYNLRNTQGNLIYVIEYVSKLVNVLDIAENIYEIKRGTGWHYISKENLSKNLEKLFETYHIRIDPNKKVSELTIYERCVIEVLKSMELNKRLIVINDLSGCFDEKEKEEFHTLLKQIVREGKSVLYIGVECEDMENLCDRVILMKDGRDIRTYYFNEMTVEEQKIMIKNLYPSTKVAAKYTENDTRITYRIKNTSMGFEKKICIKEGECIMVYPLKKKYIDWIKTIIYDNAPDVEMEITIYDRLYDRNKVKKMIGKEIVYMDEGYMENMLFYNLSYLENLSLWIEKKTTYTMSKIRKAIVTEIYPKVGDEIYATNISLLEQESKINIIYYKIYLLRPVLVLMLFPFANADLYIRQLIIRRIQELKEIGVSIILFDTNQIDTSFVVDEEIIWN